MKIYNLKMILRKQINEFRIRLFFFIPLYFVFILVFIVSDFNNGEFKKIVLMKNIQEYYKILYSNYSQTILNHIIFLDIRLMNYLLITTFIIPLFWTTEMIVREKEERTIEHLFVLPVKDSEIIWGKMLLSIISTISLIIILYVICYLYIYYKYPSQVSNYMLSFKWISTIFIGTPLLSIFVNFVAIILSSLTNKFQTAQYLAVLFLTPFFALYLLFYNGTLILGTNFLVTVFILLFCIDVIFIKYVSKLFNREKILLRI